MPDGSENIQEQQNQESQQGIQFEDIVPWGTTGGDTGLSSRLKLKRNFAKIKIWMDSILSTLNTLVGDKFLSKINDDEAAGHITFRNGLTAKILSIFEKGLRVGNYSAGTSGASIGEDGNAEVGSLTARLLSFFKRGFRIGEYVPGVSGGSVDQHGNGELESLVLRTFLEAPEFRINSVSINVGDDYHTNGRGLIEWVTPDVDQQGNLLASGTFGLHLEDGVPGAVSVGDRCKGIVNNMLDALMAEDQDKDDGRGNRAFRGFYTTFFQITQVSSIDGGINNVCRYALRPTITVDGVEYWRRDDGTSSGVKGGARFHPVMGMTFAQYSHPTDHSRQSARYSTVGTNTYTRFLRNMTGWDESLANIAVQIGNTPLIASAFPDNPQAQQAGLYSVWIDGDIFFSGNLVRYDSWGREIVVHPDQGDFQETGVDYYYNDLVHYQNKLWYCVYAEKDANGLYKPLRLAHVDAQHPDGRNCLPGEDVHWMIYLETESLKPEGAWRSEKVPYAANVMTTLGLSIYISKVETSNPPVGLLKDKNGHYLLNESGGYIIANDTVTDDWELLFSVPDITRGSDGEDALNINLTNDTDTVFTDEHGNIPAGTVLPSTQGQLYDGTDFVQQGVTWSIDAQHTTGCTATINSQTGLVTVNTMTADRAIVRLVATYRNKERHRDFTFSKTFGKDKMWLVPSSNVIAYDPNTGQYSPSRITIGAYLLRGSHGTEETVDDSTKGYFLYSRMNPSTGVIETVRGYHNTAISIDANVFIDNELAIVLYDKDGAKQDAESVPMVKNGLNAKSLQARYSADGENWHGTYQDGDVWMQTREEGGQWGDSIHIVGETGQGIRCDFNVSMDKVSANVTTPPANCAFQQWQDGPVVTPYETGGHTYPYLWMKLSKVLADGSLTDIKYIRLTGEDGKSVTNQGAWRSENVPYAEQVITSLAGWSFISKRQTSNPPLGLLKNKNGNYITTKDGGYIVANNTVSDDWDVLAAGGTSIRIVSKLTEYAIGTNGIDRPTSGWSQTQPELHQGQWLWTRRRIEYSDGNVVEDYSVSYAGIDPDGFESVRTEYAKTNQQLTMPRDEGLVTWYESFEETGAQQGDYVWTRITIKYDNDDKPPVKSFTCNRIGKDGSAVIGMEEMYLATASPSQVPSKSAQGWSENYPSQTIPYIYVWNYERTTYSNGTVVETDVHCLNPNGKGIQNIINRYAISASGVGQQGAGYPSDISNSDWTDEVVDRAPTKEKPYQWNWERVNFTDGTHTDTYHVSAVRGGDGEGFTFKGPWKSYNVPYAKQEAVSLAGSSFIAKRQTSNPPLGLLKNKNGYYVTTKDGGYIVANNTLSDDWDYMAEGGSKVLGENAVFVDFINDSITCHTDAEGNMLPGQNLTAVARLFDGRQVPNGSISWSLVCTDCTAAINSLTGVITILSVTGGTSARSASVLAIATYKGLPYSKQLGISKSFGTEVWDLTFSPDELIFNPNTNLFTAASVTFRAKRGLNGQSSPVTSGIGFIVVNGRTATNLLLHDGDTLTIAQLQQNYGLPENANMTNMTLRVELYSGENYSGGNWKWMDGEDLAVVVSGKAGTNGTYNKYAYAKSAQRATQDSYTAPPLVQGSDWGPDIPSPGVAEFVWERITPVDSAGTDGTPQYFCMTGLKGDPGATGHTGRWYEYLGVWGTDTTSAVNTDDHGWFVKYGDNFYMNVKDDKDAQGHYIPNTSTPSGASGSGWEQMDGIRQYFMAKAIFADYAQFGAFYINLDWMVSAYGTIDGTLYRGQYYGYAAATLFNPTCMPSGKKDLSVNTAVNSGSYTNIKTVSMTKGMRILKITGRASSGTLKVRTSYDTEHEASITSTSDTSVILVTEIPPSDVKIQAQGYGYITSIEELSFVPQFAVDGKSGKLYVNDGYFRGTIYATDGTFAGTVKASKFYFADQYIYIEGNGSTVARNIESGKQLVIVNSRNIEAANKVVLPSASDNEGAVIDIYNYRGLGSSSYPSAALTVVQQGDAPVGNAREAYLQDGWPTIVNGEKVRVWSNGTAWWCIEKTTAIPGAS